LTEGRSVKDNTMNNKKTPIIAAKVSRQSQVTMALCDLLSVLLRN